MNTSLIRFVNAAEMLRKALGFEIGMDIFLRVLEDLIPGRHIFVPKFKVKSIHSAEYYWNHNRCETYRFEKVRDMMRRELGKSSGVVVFNRLVMELGPGDWLTVPFFKCNDETCKCNKLCLWRERRNELIRGEFNGRNFTELSIQFSLSERQIRRIVNEDYI